MGIALHYRVGFRSDPLHRPGLAHLVEHLMFQGSENLPDSAYFTSLYAYGGTAGGTTHQDYTDYFHSVPAEALQQALEAEADRMRAPRFTSDGIRRQVAAIQEEVELAHRKGAFAGFPWPMLADVLFGNPANARDGYGNARTLDGTSVQECAEFFTTHYAPGNAVLTLSGGVSRPVSEWVADYFGRIPARAVPRRPALDEPPLTSDHVVTRVVPGRGPAALAVGYRLPATGTGLPRYLAYLLLARSLPSLGRSGGPESAPTIEDARCGFFSAFDAVDPDALVITVRRPRAASVEEALGVLDRGLSAAMEGAVDDATLKGLVRRTVLEQHREHDAPVARARALGRLEALFGRGELLDELPDLLRAVNTHNIATAAAELRAAHRAVLHVEPQEDKATARQNSGPRRVATGTGGDAGTGADGSAGVSHAATPAAGTVPGRGSTSSPSLNPLAPPLFTVYSEATPYPNRTGEPHIVVIHDDRAPVIEVRLCLTLRDANDAPIAFALAEILAHRWTADPDLEGDCTTSVEGVRVQLNGWLPRSARHHWSTALAQLIREPLRSADVLTTASRASARLRRSLHDPAWALDRATLRLLHGAAGGAGPTLRPGIEALIGQPMPFTGAVLVAVGDLDPDQATADARQTFDRAGEPPRQYAQATSPAEELLCVRRPGPAFALWCAPEAVSHTTAAALYLAVALVGGHPGARLTSDRGSASEVRAMAGRDGRFGVRRVTVTTLPGPENTEEAVSRLRIRLRDLGQEQATVQEISAARAFCTGQAVRIDTQQALADQLLAWVLLGHPVSQLAWLPHEFGSVHDADVARAVRELFAEPAFAGALFHNDHADALRSAP